MNKERFPRERFTEEEAEAKIGRRIITLVDFSGVPKETTGQVTQADSLGIEEGGSDRTFTVAIQWNLPRSKPQAELVIPDKDEPYAFVQTGKPLVDWFTKDEYEQYLEELS